MNGSEPVFAALKETADHLLRLAASDAGLQKAVRRLADALYAATTSETQRPTGVVVSQHTVDPSHIAATYWPQRDLPQRELPQRESSGRRNGADDAAADTIPAGPTEPVADLAAKLTLGRGELTGAATNGLGELGYNPFGYPPPPALEDLPPMAERCRLKATAARRMSEALTAHAGIAVSGLVSLGDLLDEASTLGCPLWMAEIDRLPQAGDVEAFREAAGCYQTLAETLDLLYEVWTEPMSEPLLRHETLRQGAAAQSTVYSAVRGLGGPPDKDQTQTFIWLRDTAREHRFFIERYFRRDDPASPTMWVEVSRNIERLRDEFRRSRESEKKLRKLFSKLRHKREQIVAGEMVEGSWETFAEAVAELHTLGVPASDSRFRELVPPAELWPADAPGSLGQVLQEVGTHLTRQTVAATARRLESDQNLGVPASEAASVAEAVERAGKEFAAALAFPLNSRSEVKTNPFEDPAAVYRALRFLATTYRDSRAGRITVADLDVESRQQCGFRYAPHQSDATIGMFPEYYRATWGGREVLLEHHLAKGQDHDPRHTLRIGFHWEPESEQIVVGYIGQHQRTRRT